MERLTRKNKHEQWVAPFCTRYDDEDNWNETSVGNCLKSE